MIKINILVIYQYNNLKKKRKKKEGKEARREREGRAKGEAS